MRNSSHWCDCVISVVFCAKAGTALNARIEAMMIYFMMFSLEDVF
ncbi:hypothetical protein MKleb_5555 (plasmid) [Klebsiella sp. PL-2018]|nr:hypothetical protein MKleb_5399 [Klebsiella sp. PL-2018]QXD01056.1 hypothetical protein MKleb_5555 [Klebsiella sp. PL-2018]